MKLDIESGGKRWQVGLPEGSLFLKVGSGLDCDVQIADASTIHAKFENFMGKWTVTDQMSDTGTRLNGEAAYSSELKPGDLVEIGSAKIRILQGEAGPSPKPPPSPVPMAAPPGLSFSVDQPLASTGKFEQAALRPATQEEFESALRLDSRAAAKPQAKRPREKTPQELFAEEVASRPAPVQQVSAQSERTPQELFAEQMSSARPAQKKGSPVMGFIIMGAILLCIVGAVVSSIMDDMNTEPPPWAANETPSAEAGTGGGGTSSTPGKTSTPDSKRLPAAKEKAYREKIQALAKRKDPWEDRLAELDQIVAELKGKQHNLEWEIENAQRSLEHGLLLEMSDRSSKDQREIYDLVEAKKYREAVARLVSLRDYGAKTKYHEKMSDTAGIKEYVDREIPEVDAANLQWINDQMYEGEKALSRNDYALALVPMAELLENASLSDQFKGCLSVEVEQLRARLQKQKDGTLPAPTPAFDKKKWKLPAAPKTDLMPDGENGRWKFMNPLLSRLRKEAAEGKLTGKKVWLFGKDTLVGEKDSYRITLVFTCEMANAATDGSTLFDFTVKRQPTDLPAATVLSLYEQFEKPTRDEFLGMLLYCYDNALMDDAPRLAWKLWKADGTVKTDLDKLLAAKLGIEVPAGGFIERDGRLEPK